MFARLLSWPKLIGAVVGVSGVLGMAPLVAMYDRRFFNPWDLPYLLVFLSFVILSYPLARGHDWGTAHSARRGDSHRHKLLSAAVPEPAGWAPPFQWTCRPNRQLARRAKVNPGLRRVSADVHPAIFYRRRTMPPECRLYVSKNPHRAVAGLTKRSRHRSDCTPKTARRMIQRAV